MKTRNCIIAFIFLFTVYLMVSDVLNNNASSHASGAPPARTGSPGDGNLTCTTCHGGPAAAIQTGWITSTIPASGYVPGTTYTITATATRTGHVKFGFEISPQNATGAQRGTLIVTSAQTHIVGTNYITHSTGGTSGTDSKTWTFNWTAPVAGTGSLTFYGAFLITNNSNSSAGDTTYKSTLAVSECAAPAQPASITGSSVVCPASSQTYSVPLDVNATGYTWTLPSGWTGSSTSNSILATSGTSSGTISVVASSACGNSAAQTFTVTVDQLSVSETHSNVSCYNGSNGSATAVPVSGNIPYTYSWSSGGTSATTSNLAAGTYTVLVTDATTCSATTTATITQPDSISLSTTHSNVNCDGGTNGSVTITAGGGTPGYTYAWSPSGGAASTASNLSAGNYTVTVTDTNGCIKTITTNVSQPSAVAATTTSQTNVTCNGGTNGTATVTASGGTPGYTYAWSPSGGNAATASNLSAGIYTVTITDTHGCLKIHTVNITQPGQITALSSSVNADCVLSDGSASVNVSGGTPGYTYAWNTAPVQTSATAINLSAGVYSVAVTDTNGCSSVFNVTINNNTSLLTQVDTITPVSCFGSNNGSASISASGGAPSYTYNWFPSGGDSTTASNLPGGTYFVTVTDSLGCVSSTIIEVPEPDSLVANAGNDTSLCNGESIVIGGSSVASGGTAPYVYSWSPSVGLDSTSAEHPQASPVASVTYSLNLTDSKGCAANSVIQIVVRPSPQIPVISQNSDSLLSTFAYFYQWFLNGDTIPTATNQVYVPLQNGNYSVAIDSNGCTAFSSAYFFNTIGIQEATGNNGVGVYPNPYHDKTTIVYVLRSPADVLIEAYTLTGIKINTLVNQKQNSGTYRLPFSAGEKNYPAGVYVLRMSIGDNTFKELLLEIL